MSIHSMAGKKAPKSMLVNIPRLVSAYYINNPDVNIPGQQVVFGTSGHRGNSLQSSFNEQHIHGITQAICCYRKAQNITGPLFIGFDTHALSEPAFISAVEVLAANNVETFIAKDMNYTPTPGISHAILKYNKGRKVGLADGIVITPSHNPPDNGGIKYNPPNGGPADTHITKWIADKANQILLEDNQKIKRLPYEKALKTTYVHEYDFITPYVNDLEQVIDMEVIKASGLKLGADALGGAGLGYWAPIAETYGLDIDVINGYPDPAFGFMNVDADGKIRMDCSSPYAMAGLIDLKGKYDLAFGNDPDFDRHGIVAPSVGLMNPNHYLSVAAGASFLRKDGTVWTTDKDGIILCLLAAEITAKTGRDPGLHYQDLSEKFGAPVYARIDAPANTQQKTILSKLSPEQVKAQTLAGEIITAKLTKAPSNQADIGGLKVCTENGWFAARPSGTEEVYKIYAESFKGVDHLKQIQEEAKEIVNEAFRTNGV
ncbi:MAG: phosphoglucomutase, alpha-D-glucose phosphate-specific [Firmicutes bacterium]|nr:phosphoglucomutase, alpha-D-glucose phosphate-specific [Bacillota bacterium]